MIRKLVQAAILAILLIAVTLQFAQRTDRTFPLLYFTIDSALLYAAVIARSLLRPATDGLRFARIEGAAATGVTLSAIVYAIVIAPASPSGTWISPGDDPLVATATVLLHGVAPALVVAEYVTRYQPHRLTLLDACAFLWWPTTYQALVGGMAAVSLAVIPYPFLRPSESGTFPVLIAMLGIGAVTVTVGTALLTGQQLLQRLLYPGGPVSRN